MRRTRSSESAKSGPERGPADRLFVDSGGWIAYFHARDDHHPAADALFRAALRNRVRLVTTDAVLSEVHRAVLFRLGPRRARDAVAAVEDLTTDFVFVDEQHHEAAKKWLAKLDDQEITYTDAVSFAVMEALRLERAISFDDDFTIAGFELAQAPSK